MDTIKQKYMAKLSFVLDKRTPDKLGNCQIKLRIVAGISNTTIRTNVFIPEGAFTGNPESVVGRSVANARLINKELREIYYHYAGLIIDLEQRGLLAQMTAADIRNYTRKQHVQQPVHIEHTFTSTLIEYRDSCRTDKTQAAYDYTLKMMQRFCPKDTYLFEDINYKFLTDFERWMELNSIGMASRSIVFRNIRTAYNYAINNDWVDQNTYPFRKFKIKQKRKDDIEYLPEDKMRELLSLDLSKEPGNGLALARDFFMLSFFLCGINPIDLYNLPATSGKVSFVRTKVKFHEPQPIHITIQPAAQSIIDRYKGKRHLLSLAEKYRSFENCYHFMKHRLKVLGNRIGCPGITFYWARYSWATYASKLDVSDSVISKALGHASTTLAEKRYICFDWTKVDKANSRVIEYATNG